MTTLDDNERQMERRGYTSSDSAVEALRAGYGQALKFVPIATAQNFHLRRDDRDQHGLGLWIDDKNRVMSHHFVVVDNVWTYTGRDIVVREAPPKTTKISIDPSKKLGECNHCGRYRVFKTVCLSCHADNSTITEAVGYASSIKGTENFACRKVMFADGSYYRSKQAFKASPDVKKWVAHSKWADGTYCKEMSVKKLQDTINSIGWVAKTHLFGGKFNWGKLNKRGFKKVKMEAGGMVFLIEEYNNNVVVSVM